MKTDGMADAKPAVAHRPDWRWRRDTAKEVLLVLMQRKADQPSSSLASAMRGTAHEFHVNHKDAAVAAVAITDDLLEALREKAV